MGAGASSTSTATKVTPAVSGIASDKKSSPIAKKSYSNLQPTVCTADNSPRTRDESKRDRNYEQEEYAISPSESYKAEMFTYTAMSLGMENDEFLFNLLYFGGGEMNADGESAVPDMRTMMSSALDETIALHSENNVPYKLRPASDDTLSHLQSAFLLPDNFGTMSGEEAECQVCKDELEVGCEVTQLTCGHMFHKDCVLRWFKLQAWCPVCRADIGGGGEGSHARLNVTAEEMEEEAKEVEKEVLPLSQQSCSVRLSPRASGACVAQSSSLDAECKDLSSSSSSSPSYSPSSSSSPRCAKGPMTVHQLQLPLPVPSLVRAGSSVAVAVTMQCVMTPRGVVSMEHLTTAQQQRVLALLSPRAAALPAAACPGTDCCSLKQGEGAGSGNDTSGSCVVDAADQAEGKKAGSPRSKAPPGMLPMTMTLPLPLPLPLSARERALCTASCDKDELDCADSCSVTTCSSSALGHGSFSKTDSHYQCQCAGATGKATAGAPMQTREL